MLASGDSHQLFFLHRHADVAIRASIVVLHAVRVFLRRRTNVVATGDAVAVGVRVAGIANTVAVRVSLVGIRGRRAVVLRGADAVAIGVALHMHGYMILRVVVRRERVLAGWHRLTGDGSRDLQAGVAARGAVDCVLSGQCISADVWNRDRRELAPGDDARARIQRVCPMTVARSRASELQREISVGRACRGHGDAAGDLDTGTQQVATRIVVANGLVLN
jgi:hypothetical protein